MLGILPKLGLEFSQNLIYPCICCIVWTETESHWLVIRDAVKIHFGSQKTQELGVLPRWVHTCALWSKHYHWGNPAVAVRRSTWYHMSCVGMCGPTPVFWGHVSLVSLPTLCCWPAVSVYGLWPKTVITALMVQKLVMQGSRVGRAIGITFWVIVQESNYDVSLVERGRPMPCV